MLMQGFRYAMIGGEFCAGCGGVCTSELSTEYSVLVQDMNASSV